jgi:pantothenate kinase type III
VGTGGLAAMLQPHCASIAHVEPFLTLHGLRIAHELLSARPGAAS